MTRDYDRSMRFETRAIHAGQDPDPATGAVTTPIYQTSTFAQEAVGVGLQPEDAAVAEQRPRMTFSRSWFKPQLSRARESLGGSETTKGIHRTSLRITDRRT